MKKLFTLVLLLLMAAPFLLFAGTTGKLTGTVTDKTTGEALPFVNIILEGTNLGAASDIDGKYVILNIPPGKYSVKFQYIGYQTYVVEGVSVSIDLTTKVDAELSEVSLELQTVVVQATADVLKKDITSSQATVSASDIANLPVAEINDVLQLQAGITRDADGGFHVRGGRSSEISYKVNGITVTDAYDNSRGIEIDNSSIQEVQVISGTFNAEHGDAMSGIINAVTKEGGQKYTGQIKLYSSDYLSDFTDYFTNIDDYNPVANYNIQGSVSGPVPATSNKVAFFVNARYNYDDGYLYGLRKFNSKGDTLDGAAVPMNWSKRLIGQANLSIIASSAIKFNLEGLYSKEDYRDYNHFYKYNPDNDVTKYTNSFNSTITMTHTFSSSSFYTIKGSVFERKFKEYLFENPFDSRYIAPDSLRTLGYSFVDEGTNPHHFQRYMKTIQGIFDFTSQVSENHLMKFGAETKIHKMAFDDYNIIPKEDESGNTISPFEPDIPTTEATSREIYEEAPFEMAAYLQDKIEFENVIVNIGIRLDYFDSNGDVLVDPTDPNIYYPLRNPSDFGLTLPEDKWTDAALNDLSNRKSGFYKDAEARWALSPRFGVAYPISATGVVHFSYGQFVKIPSYRFLFDRASYKTPESGSTGSVFGNPALKPETTISYEIGFRQELSEDFLLDVTSFYRDIRDWVSSSPVIYTRNGVGYYTYINKDYANVKGVTLSFKKRFSNFWQFDINYTFQVAEGLNSTPEEEFNQTRNGSEPALYLVPLDWEQNHLLNVSIYAGMEDWGVSLIGRYGTGLPYTPSITPFYADKGITSGLTRNSRRRPGQFTIDLRVHKSFDLFGYELAAYVQVFNLLDSKVVTNVFGDSGKPDYTTEGQNIGYDPNRPNTVEEWLRYPTNYAPPRLVQLGFEITF
ncbi:MAG: TonB-dependent receptor [bacterium]